MRFPLSAAWLISSLALSLRFGCSFGTYNIGFLLSKAEIFYQRPVALGAPAELPLHMVKDLTAKTNFKVIIHGFTGSRTHISIKPLGNAYMAVGGTNVLLADWSDVASLDYHSSRKAVGKVAKYFGKLLQDFMMRFGIAPNGIHVIGHSLGAHIAGGIGDYFNGTLGRVTGLDPALPLFTPQAADSLHNTAAQFVDVIHTDYPVFGDITPRGTADFYPSFGHTPQKGCDDFDLITANSCSHNRAVLLYAESIGQAQNFPTLPCHLNAIKQRNAEACFENVVSKADIDRATLMEAIANMDDSQVVYMGDGVSRTAYGIYYLDTYETPPFGMGVYSRF